MLCSACGTANVDHARFCMRCGRPMQGPPATPTPAPGAGGTSALIPYRNAPALAAYYCAVFSLIPVVGVPLALAAVILGFMGRSRAAREPGVHGTAHAWVGIVLGSLVLLGYLALGAFLLLSLRPS